MRRKLEGQLEYVEAGGPARITTKPEDQLSWITL